MKIELEEPYKSMYASASVHANADGRKLIALIKPDGKGTVTSYARYLYGVKLGHLVPDDLEVDHINDDKTDDRIENLQLLTPEQNRLKQQYHYIEHEQVCYGFECTYCETRFLLTERQVKMRLAQNVENAFCSRACSFNFNRENKEKAIGKTITEEQISLIKDLRSQGYSSYKITEITGIARNTVMKYWNPDGNIVKGSSKKGTDIVAIDNITKIINVYDSIMNCSKALSISHETISDWLYRKESFDYKEYTIMKLSTYLETHKKIKGNPPCVK